LPPRWTTWLTAAIVEEETELEEAIRPLRGARTDVVTAVGALVVVVVASSVMEQGASVLGQGPGSGRTQYCAELQHHQCGRRVSDPCCIHRIGEAFKFRTSRGRVVPGITVLTLVLAYVGRGLRRSSGWLIIAAYVVFAAMVLATA
jgi:hypothetical protein